MDHGSSHPGDESYPFRVGWFTVFVAVFEYNAWLMLLPCCCLSIVRFFDCVGVSRESFGGMNELDGVFDVVQISKEG